MRKIFFKINKITRIFTLLALVLVIGKVSVHEEAKTVNNNLNKTLDLHAMAAVIEQINYNDLYTPLDNYVGYLTGYGANCPLCSGFLGCTGADVRDGRTTYSDKEYGSVRIVASSKNMPCGSIISFESKKISDKPVLAIVLDRGVSGTAIDLLTESEDYARNYVGRSQIKYDLLRKGWEKRGE